MNEKEDPIARKRRKAHERKVRWLAKQSQESLNRIREADAAAHRLRIQRETPEQSQARREADAKAHRLAHRLAQERQSQATLDESIVPEQKSAVAPEQKKDLEDDVSGEDEVRNSEDDVSGDEEVRNSEDDSPASMDDDQPTQYTVVAIEMPMPTTSVLAADSTVMRNPTVSLPATNNWPGDYLFDITFPSNDKTASKRFDWTYSPLHDKLYVVKDMPCPINFSTSYTMPEGTIIRATAVFTSPENTSEFVRRCVNHCIEDANKGVMYPDHLIRCECNQASYEEDPVTHRQSVTVPYENPQSGEKHSTYIFKFVCWGSCTGGLNRRSVAVVFNLEHGGQIIGRRSIELRICACPIRDRRQDEKAFLPDLPPSPESAKRKHSTNITSLPDILNFVNGVNYPFPKKMKSVPVSTDGSYTITASDRKMYEFLMSMKLFYEICITLKNVAPQFQKNLLNSCFLKKGRTTGDSREAP